MAQPKYFSTQATPGPWDYIVIGSGMGGMTAAALLNKLGKRVLVLEQHYVPGGFTHAFKRKKWEWDAGVHAIGEVTDRAMVGKFLDYLTDGKLEWASLGPVYDEFIFPGGFHLGFPDSRQKFRTLLLEHFPNERDGIDDYFRLVKEVAGHMRGYYLQRVMPHWMGRVAGPVLSRKAESVFGKCTQDVINGLTDDPRLRTILTAQWGYYGSPPSESSFAGHALTAKHFFYGGYYPVGGSHKIAECLLKPVVESGGAVRIRADVQEIIVEGGRAVGVRLKKDNEVIRAGAVISAAGALNTVKHLLPNEYKQEEWSESVGALKSSPAHVCLYLGFKGDIRKAGAGSANKWFYEHWDHNVSAWDPRTEEEAPILYTSFPSLKDPTYDPGPEELHTAEVVTFLPPDMFNEWENKRWMKRGEDYEAIKADIAKKLKAQLLKYMPGLEPMIAYEEVSTPLSTMHFTRADQGAIYGLQATPERFNNPWLRPRTPIRGLFMAGCDVSMVGVIGAMVGGALAGLAAEPRKALPFFAGLSRDAA